jgi:hypothetical protein
MAGFCHSLVRMEKSNIITVQEVYEIMQFFYTPSYCLLLENLRAS